MSQIPIVQSLHQEFVSYVVVVETDQTMDEMAEAVSATNIAFETNRRRDAPLRVRRCGEASPFPRDMKVADAGIQPMTALEFYFED